MFHCGFNLHFPNDDSDVHQEQDNYAHIIPEILDHSGKEKEIKGVRIEKEEVKIVSICRWLFLYVENPKDSTKTSLDLITEFSKAAGYKITIQKSVPF